MERQKILGRLGSSFLVGIAGATSVGCDKEVLRFPYATVTELAEGYLGYSVPCTATDTFVDRDGDGDGDLSHRTIYCGGVHVSSSSVVDTKVTN